MGGWIAIIIVICWWLKEVLTPITPAEDWANEALLHKDRMSGMSEKEILRNVALGKYRLPKESREKNEQKDCE